MLPRADSENAAGTIAGPDDHVIRLRRAVHEVPLPQRPLLAFDEQKRFAVEDEEVLLVSFPVVHPDRLARSEDDDGDPELREERLALLVRPPRERQAVPASLAVPPACLPSVDDEPAGAGGREAVSGLLERCFRDHGSMIGGRIPA